MQNALSFIGFVPPDENDLVKRVIAVGGQTVECRASTGLTVDGKPLNEPYLDPTTMMADPKVYPCLGNEFGPVKVPDGRLWVMGDNRTPFGRFAGALREPARRRPAGTVVHRRPDAGNGADRQCDREGAVLIHTLDQAGVVVELGQAGEGGGGDVGHVLFVGAVCHAVSPSFAGQSGWWPWVAVCQPQCGQRPGPVGGRNPGGGPPRGCFQMGFQMAISLHFPSESLGW